MISCVYAITNLLTADRYIGSTIDFQKRVAAHLSALKRGNHPNRYLQRAWRKHRPDNFAFCILSVVERDQCLSAEQTWIDCFSPSYNICLSVSAPMLGRVASEETRKKMRIVSTGRKHTEAAKMKMSAARKLIGGRPRSIQTRLKMSAAHKGRKFDLVTRSKLSQRQIGSLNHQFGKRQSPETVAKRRAALIGHPVSIETRNKISSSKLGVLRTIEQRKRIRDGIRAFYAKKKEARL